KFLTATPPNVLSKPNTVYWLIKSIASLFVNGTGINVPKRKTININNVNTIFRLISRTFMKLDIVRNIRSPRLYRLLLQLLLLQKLRIYSRSEEHTSELQSRFDL